MKDKFPPQFLQQIKEQIDLVDFVSRYIHLNRNLKAVCPFHPEKHPSFSVHPQKQIWRCFGCGLHGDIFAFVQLIEKLNFSDTVKLLAEKAGIPLPKSERFKNYISRKWMTKKKLLDRLELCKWYLKQAEIERIAELRSERRKLPPKSRWDSWDARDYLKEQIIEYKLDCLDTKMRKIRGELADKATEIRNG